MKKIVLATLLLFFSSFAHSSYYTAAKLLDEAESKNDIESLGSTAFISGWMRGVLVAQIAYQVTLNQPKFICMPEELHAGIAEKIFIKYANENPEQLVDPAALLLFRALKNAYPCK